MKKQAPSQLQKLSFLLTEDQRGPYPIDGESIWCDPVGKYFRIKNIPFFIDGIAYDDVIEVEPVQDRFIVKRVVSPSGNSTVWIFLESEPAATRFVAELKRLGCGVEGGVLHNYLAFNIPSSVDGEHVLGLIVQAVDKGWIDADYPCIRVEGASE